MARKVTPEILKRPSSCSNILPPLLGLVGITVSLYTFRAAGLCLNDLIAILCLSYFIPVFLMEIFVMKTHRNPSTGLQWNNGWHPDKERLIHKFLGLTLSIIPIFLMYALFDLYQSDFYKPFHKFLGERAIWLLPVLVIYTIFIDGYMKQPVDIYAKIGQFILKTSPEKILPREWKDHVLSLLLRGFFIAALFCCLHSTLEYIVETLHSEDYINLEKGWVLAINNVYAHLDFYATAIWLMSIMMSTMALTAYLSCMRLTDSHIRSMQPHLIGWVTTLIFYAPFITLLKNFADYEDGIFWEDTILHIPYLNLFWHGMLIATLAITTISIAYFGLRYSNLTHRGIITDGPYRFLKHPDYVARALYGALMTVPFTSYIPDTAAFNGKEAIINTLFYTLFCLFYFWRAKAEEKHLSEDPTYVQYALWMNKHGAFAWFTKMFPQMAYKAPKK